jgi:phosphoenolpyruvate-protein kinase (PTS system EI component)
MLLDGGAGVAVLHPAARTRSRFRQPGTATASGRRSTSPDGPAIDVEAPTLRCNASTLAEIEAGLAAGAAGVGLLRTEIPFLDATSWPSEATSTLALAPLLIALRGHTATVRLFDFGGDKVPPFLTERTARGVALLLQHPEECSAQLRAILRCGLGSTLRLLVPMVETAQQLASVRDLLTAAIEECGPAVASQPPLGAMIESPDAVLHIDEIVTVADFVSIGTNDLVASTLGIARGDPASSAAAAADPAVIGQVAGVVEAARQASIGVAVCGEAAAIPDIARTLVGLGVTELSVAPSRLAAIREAVRSNAQPELAR